MTLKECFISHVSNLLSYIWKENLGICQWNNKRCLKNSIFEGTKRKIDSSSTELFPQINVKILHIMNKYNDPFYFRNKKRKNSKQLYNLKTEKTHYCQREWSSHNKSWIQKSVNLIRRCTVKESYKQKSKYFFVWPFFL